MNNKLISARVPETIGDALKQLAEIEDRSISYVVRQILSEHIKNK